MEIRTTRHDARVRSGQVRQSPEAQSPNEQYDSLEIGVGQRVRSTLKGLAAGAALGGGVAALTGALISLSSASASAGLFLQTTLGLAAGTGAIGAAVGLAGSRNLAQLDYREEVQNQAVETAEQVSDNESPTRESWSKMERLGLISNQPGLADDGVPLVRGVFESLQTRGAEFVDCGGPEKALGRLRAGKPLKLKLEGESTITSVQGLLAFDVTRGSGTKSLPKELSTLWDRCRRSLEKLPQGKDGAPRDRLEELLTDYAGPNSALRTANSDFKSYSDIEHFDYLERGGPIPTKPHESVSFLSELADKSYELRQYSFDDSWALAPFQVYLGMRDNRHDNLLLNTPEGEVPIHLNSAIADSVKSYENEGMKSLVDHFNSLKRFHSIPTDTFHQQRRAEQHQREVAMVGVDQDVPLWFSEGFK